MATYVLKMVSDTLESCVVIEADKDDGGLCKVLQAADAECRKWYYAVTQYTNPRREIKWAAWKDGVVVMEEVYLEPIATDKSQIVNSLKNQAGKCKSIGGGWVLGKLADAIDRDVESVYQSVDIALKMAYTHERWIDGTWNQYHKELEPPEPVDKPDKQPRFYAQWWGGPDRFEVMDRDRKEVVAIFSCDTSCITGLENQRAQARQYAEAMNKLAKTVTD